MSAVNWLSTSVPPTYDWIAALQLEMNITYGGFGIDDSVMGHHGQLDTNAQSPTRSANVPNLDFAIP